MKTMLGFSAVAVVSLGFALWVNAEPASGGSDVTEAKLAQAKSATQPGAGKHSIADRLSCSTLCQRKHSTEEAFKAIADMGFKYVDLSCLTWAPHVNVIELRKDFDKEAKRVEGLLAKYELKVSNFTYDPMEVKAWPEYEADFRAMARLAPRLKAKVINIMAPKKDADWQDAVGKLRKLQAIAAEHGVQLTVETHVGQMTELPADAARLCKEVPGLGLTLDPSHYYAGLNQGKPFDSLYPLVRGTGFRAGGLSFDKIQMAWGEGPIEFAKIVRDLEAADYKGFYAAEYLEAHGPVDALDSSRKFLAWGKKLTW